MKSLHSSRNRGFTILEVAIVVSVVAILSWLALVAIGRVKERAVRSLIANNLRQFYDAKEYYYSETGDIKPTSIVALARNGYATARLREALMTHTSMEASQGWHYLVAVMPGAPTLAYQGVKPANAAPTGEAIYYPAPPDSSPAATATAQFPVQPPATQPPVALPVPAGMIGGSTPLAPWASSHPRPLSPMGSMEWGEDGFRILNNLRAASPDGKTPVRITDIQIDPSLGTVVPNPQNRGGWIFKFAQPATQTPFTATVTLDNGAGQTQVQIQSSH